MLCLRVACNLQKRIVKGHVLVKDVHGGHSAIGHIVCHGQAVRGGPRNRRAESGSSVTCVVGCHIILDYVAMRPRWRQTRIRQREGGFFLRRERGRGMWCAWCVVRGVWCGVRAVVAVVAVCGE